MANRKQDHSSYYLQLKDKSLAIEDRLKLVRFAWKSTDVFIPNKEQVLVDLVFGFLINRKRDKLNAKECLAVWTCLYDILSTRKVAESSTLLLRHSSTQVLTNALLSSDETESPRDVAPVIGCCLKIITSPVLASVFSAKPEEMVMLLTGFCKLLKTNNSENRASLSSLIRMSVQVFTKAVWTAPNQNMILKKTCDSLLPAFIAHWCDQPSDDVKSLSQAVTAVLCHRDHVKGYAAYFKVKTEYSAQPQKQTKSVDLIFNAFTKCMKTGDKDRCVRFLAVFFQHFITNDCHAANHVTAHHMVLELCTLIGLSLGNQHLTGTLAPSTVFRGVNQLLRIVSDQELYDLVGNDSAVSQIHFYKHVVTVLLKHAASNSVTADWFACFTTLLQLNHMILEPSLIELFTVGWMHDSIQEEDIGGLDLLLADLVQIYEKLRQVPKLINKILAALCGYQGNRNLPLTPKLLHSYGQMVQSLPQTVMVDVWKSFNTCLKENFLQPSKDSDRGHFHGVCSLLHHFLMNVKVADNTITEMTLTSVTDLVVTMETDILTPILKSLLNAELVDKTRLKFTLYVCYALGEVLIMLSFYKKYRASHFQSASVVSHSGDLTLVHSYLNQSVWKKVFKLSEKQKDAGLCHLWRMLTVQKVKCTLLFKNSTEWSEMADVMEMTLTFTKSPPGTMETWSGNLEDITEDNSTVASWHLLVSNMAAVQCVLSQKQRRNIATFIFRSFLTKTDRILGDYSLTEDFCHSKVMAESSLMINDVITLLWQQCLICFQDQLHKLKKKGMKQKTVRDVTAILDYIADMDKPWGREMNSECLETVKVASSLLAELMGSDMDKDVQLDWTDIHVCLQLLTKFELDQLWACDQIRCVLGLMTFKVVLDTDNTQQNEAATGCSDLCVEMCTQIISECGRIPVFQVLDVPAYLQWLENCLNKETQQENMKMLLLAEVSCEVMIQDYPVLATLPPHVLQLCTKLSKKKVSKTDRTGALSLISFILHNVCKLLNRAYLNESLKVVCNEIFSAVSKVILDLAPLVKSSQFDHKEAVIVLCCSMVLSSLSRHEKLTPDLLEVFVPLVTWSCTAMDTNMGKRDVYTVLSALTFLHMSARHHQILKDVFVQEMKVNVWEHLVNAVRNLLLNQSVDSKRKTSLDGHSLKPARLTEIASSKESDTRKKHSKKRKHKEISMDEDRAEESENEHSAKRRLESHTEETVKQMTAIFVADVVDGEIKQSNIDIDKPESAMEIDTSTVTVDPISNKRKDFDINSVATNSSSAVNFQYKCLVLKGRVEEERSRLLLQQTQVVMAAILVTFDLDKFRDVIRQLEHDVHPNSVQTDRKKISVSLYIWQNLLKLDFSDEQMKIVNVVAKDLMLNFQSITAQLQYTVTEEVVTEIILPILSAQHQMLLLGKKFLRPRTSVLCLHSAMYAPLEGSTYLPVFHAVCSLLTSLLVQHTDTVFLNIPTFMACAKRLLLSVVEKSNQEQVSDDTELLHSLANCAFQMEKLFSLIATHKVEFGKLAAYVIADYVTAVQKVTLLPALKRALVPAIYKMFDLCDRHAISQLHVVLNHGVTEVFKLLYNEYTKFHKYYGKV